MINLSILSASSLRVIEPPIGRTETMPFRHQATSLLRLG